MCICTMNRVQPFNDYVSDYLNYRLCKPHRANELKCFQAFNSLAWIRFFFPTVFPLFCSNSGKTVATCCLHEILCTIHMLIHTRWLLLLETRHGKLFQVLNDENHFVQIRIPPHSESMQTMNVFGFETIDINPTLLWK